MANKDLFKSTRGRTVPATDTTNAAGGRAYTLSPKAALARYAATGCLSNTYYVKAEDHLDRVLDLAGQCDPEFVAKLAVFARKEGHMKDMPALLLAHLATRGDDGRGPLKAAFPLAIDNGRMLRNFVQILRSGRLGRKSMGSGPRNLVRGFFARHQPHYLFRQLAVGQNPSGADIIKMVHPKGVSPEHDALFGYMIGKVKPGGERWDKVPPLVAQFEAWKADKSLPPPPVPFELLTAQQLTSKQWETIFLTGGWHFIRMNLNTAQRHGVLEKLKEPIALRLKDAETIRKVRAMPYQLLAAYRHAENVPRVIVEALHDALEIAVENVPKFVGKTLVIVDVSGSMRHSVTGAYSQNYSKVRCTDVAALFASAIVRQNPETVVIPVDTQSYPYLPEPRNTILTEADRLSRFGGGGTALARALVAANKRGILADNVVILSDQESWADDYPWGVWGPGAGAALMHEWEGYRHRNPAAKLICVDICPGRTHQSLEGRNEILHVAGWNDSVFKVAAAFLNGSASSWLEVVEGIDLSWK